MSPQSEYLCLPGQTCQEVPHLQNNTCQFTDTQLLVRRDIPIIPKPAPDLATPWQATSMFWASHLVVCPACRSFRSGPSARCWSLRRGTRRRTSRRCTTWWTCWTTASPTPTPPSSWPPSSSSSTSPSASLPPTSWSGPSPPNPFLQPCQLKSPSNAFPPLSSQLLTDGSSGLRLQVLCTIIALARAVFWWLVLLPVQYPSQSVDCAPFYIPWHPHSDLG